MPPNCGRWGGRNPIEALGIADFEDDGIRKDRYAHWVSALPIELPETQHHEAISYHAVVSQTLSEYQRIHQQIVQLHEDSEDKLTFGHAVRALCEEFLFQILAQRPGVRFKVALAGHMQLLGAIAMINAGIKMGDGDELIYKELSYAAVGYHRATMRTGHVHTADIFINQKRAAINASSRRQKDPPIHLLQCDRFTDLMTFAHIAMIGFGSFEKNMVDVMEVLHGLIRKRTATDWQITHSERGLQEFKSGWNETLHILMAHESKPTVLTAMEPVIDRVYDLAMDTDKSLSDAIWMLEAFISDG